MSRKFNIVLMLLFLAFLSGCVGPVSFTAVSPDVNSSNVQNGSYELTGSGTISENISGEILRTERDVEVTSEIRVYRKYDMTNIGISTKNNYTNKSTRQIINESNIEIEELVEISELAERDSVLTEDSIQSLRDDNISMWRIIERSDVELDELVSREEIIRRVNAEGGQIQKADENKPRSTYVVLVTPSVQTGEGTVQLKSRDIEEMASLVSERTGDKIKIGEKIQDEGGADIYEATSPELGQIEIVFSEKKIDENSVVSFGYYNKSDTLRDELISITNNTSIKGS